MNRCRLLVIGTMAWLLSGCQAMPGLMPVALPPVSPPTTFKVLTYNTLHGLEVGKLWVRQVETDEQHRARFTLRIKQLAEAQPDVILLQEVNPLPAMAGDYVQALKQQGAGLCRSASGGCLWVAARAGLGHPARIEQRHGDSRQSAAHDP